MANEEALKCKKEIARLEMRMIKYCAPINSKIRELEEQLNRTCIHDDTERKDSYESGSYYDTCKYIHEVVCKVCGKIISRDVTYGGYG